MMHLKKVSAFDGLTDKDMIQLHNEGKILTFKSDDIIFKEGDACLTLYILLSGSVKLNNVLNKPQIEITLFQKNSFIDEIAFSKNEKRAFTAIALEPSKVMAINEKSFDILPRHIQIILLNNVSKTTAFNAQLLRLQMNESTEVINCLSSYIKKIDFNRDNLYSKSEIIQNTLKSFPRLPVYATRLTELIMEENISVEQVVELAKADPSLIATTLKTINSPYYNLSYKVSDFQHAVMFLGFNMIYQIAIDGSLDNIMPKTENFQKIRTHSISTAFLGVEIGLQCMLQKPLIMNTIGMLHNIGKSFILLNTDLSSSSMFCNMLDDAKIGSLLLKEWNLPDKVCLAIEYYHFPEFAPPEDIPLECRDVVSVLYLARVIHENIQTKKVKEIQTPFLNHYLKALNIQKSFHSFIKEQLYPSFRRRIDTLPEELRGLLVMSSLNR